MLTAREIADRIAFALIAHDEQALGPGNRFRRWDGKTPFGVHPVTCALLVLNETRLAEEDRVDLFDALCLHDIREDTSANLPLVITDRARWLVDQLHFVSTDEANDLIWEREGLVRVGKLVDKTCNRLDASYPMPEEKREKKTRHLRRLADDVERNYGDLNVVRIARALTA